MSSAARSDVSAAGPPPALVVLVHTIDTISEWSGQIFCWLVVPLAAALTYEVLARYLFGAPTIWAYDSSYMLYGSHFMLGAGYTLLKGGHIRTDIFYQSWSPRTRGLVDSLCYLLFFFPGMAFFFWMSGQEGWHSFMIGERSDASPWRPVVYPLKLAMPLAALLLIVQGVSEFIKSVQVALRGRPL